MSTDLHPAPPVDRIDHREAHNRDQLREPTEDHELWRRAVEHIAAELQIEPIDAHFRLSRAMVAPGQAWVWWDPC